MLIRMKYHCFVEMFSSANHTVYSKSVTRTEFMHGVNDKTQEVTPFSLQSHHLILHSIWKQKNSNKICEEAQICPDSE